jgi:spermidine synthase
MMGEKVDVAASTEQAPTAVRVFAIYAIAFITGAIVMSFEMLGSRYLNPYFGSGIYTWAALISTVLAALTVGYFLGGSLADRMPSAAVLGATVLVGAAYITILPAFSGPLLEALLEAVDDVRIGSLASAFALLFFPVTFLGMYSPFAIRLLLSSAQRAGRVSGMVYGISTAGSIVGTLGTTFFLMPAIGVRAITLTLGVTGIACGLVLLGISRMAPRVRAAAAAGALAFLLSCPWARGEDIVDLAIRAQMLARPDGRIAHLESEYNDIFVGKRGATLMLSTRYKGMNYPESAANLKDPDDLPVMYTRTINTAVLYPAETKRILLIGLGGGSISTYLARHMPDVSIDAVELDPGVITAAKTYFGVRETAKVRYVEGDGRVFLNRSKEPYDVILVDAFYRAGVPFHLLTREFYELVKQRLAPGGAAAFNILGGTRLFTASVATLRIVFPTVDLYAVEPDVPEGQVIAVASADPRMDRADLLRRAGELQDRYKFRFPMAGLAALRMENPNVPKGEVLTDDFAPVNLYETMPAKMRRK